MAGFPSGLEEEFPTGDTRNCEAPEPRGPRAETRILRRRHAIYLAQLLLAPAREELA